MTLLRPTRRRFIQTTAAGGTLLAAPAILSRPVFAAETLTVADAGGVSSDACRKAFYEPFEAETGVKIVQVVREADPVTQLQLMVDSGSYLFNVALLTKGHKARLQVDKNYIATLDLDDPDNDLAPGMLTEDWMGFSIFGVLMGYETEKYGQDGPKSWRDFFDAEAFPGRRGLFRNVWGAIECTLLGAGVPKEELYPLDIDLAFATLDHIKEDVAVWWTSGAQNTQILQSGEVDISDTWTSRLFAAIEAGANLTPVWDGLYSSDGWAILAGDPKLEIGREFIKSCMLPERQAVYAQNVANAPSSRKALDLLPPERARTLATYPDNLANLVELQEAWWVTTRPAVQARMDEWLLS